VDRIITISDWWDGPLTGLAFYDGIVCIYERVFSQTDDEYTDEYTLTPVSREEESAIMAEWQEWCDAVSSGTTDLYFSSHPGAGKIQQIISQSAGNRQFRKKARFTGTVGKGYIPADYYAEWY